MARRGGVVEVRIGILKGSIRFSTTGTVGVARAVFGCLVRCLPVLAGDDVGGVPV
jgi:hypothetical protein